MTNVHGNVETKIGNAFSGATNWNDPDRATIYAGDVRQPWKAVYGFATTAARLATGQELVLHCREDEIVELMEGLNELLESPESLNQACEMLKRLQQQSEQKLARLIAVKEQPVTESETAELVAEVEQLLTEPQEQTAVDGLARILSPDHPIQEIAGARKMVARLRKLVTALGRVKDVGFHVTVRDRRRQPRHPALEARRNEPIMIDGKSGQIQAGFFQPPDFHLTLWAYLVVRSDGGQSTIWN
jgi:hypothetical protein